MRIAVVFFGLARSLPRTIDSIRRNIYHCNSDPRFCIFTLASLNVIEVISNLRSGEMNVSINGADAFLLDADFYGLAHQNDSVIADELRAAQQRSDVYRDQWASIKGMLHQLTSLRRAWHICTNAMFGHFDYFLFARPDLLYMDEIRITDLISLFREEGSIAVPAWHSYGGFNDRFAFADAVAARHYAERLTLIPEYCAERFLHPESLLAYALWKGGCRVCELPVRARRVRANGVVSPEMFDASVTPLPREPQQFRLASDRTPFFYEGTKALELNKASVIQGFALTPQAPQGTPGPAELALPRAVSHVKLGRVTQNGCQRVSPLGGIHYLDFLRLLHQKRQTGRYLEIGTQTGMSLNAATGRIVAIDPQFLLDKARWSAKPSVHLFEMTSDAFFSEHDPRDFLGEAIDVAFIDGMHLAEFVFRDFVNVERHCAESSCIVLHDAVPQNFEMTERERRPELRQDRALAAAWTGDVWRVLPLLRRERPELSIQVLDCPPTGLVLITNLNPKDQNLRAKVSELSNSLAETEATEPEFWSFIDALQVADSRAVL